MNQEKILISFMNEKSIRNEGQNEDQINVFGNSGTKSHLKSLRHWGKMDKTDIYHDPSTPHKNQDKFHSEEEKKGNEQEHQGND